MRLPILLCAFLMLAGCTTTVTKKPIVTSEASWDGGVQNSGLIAFDESGGGLVTQHFVQRYNALVEKYGDRFMPPICQNEGVEFVPVLGVYRIDQEHMTRMFEMNQMRLKGLR